ncbi:MAG: response regulator [Oscillospiraceae bacterium]|jgi:signal transduction histidine kinase/ActR/RegA family two-component response regulator|nr:response regulator [Oscillospiraceae bacterium]
MHSNDNEYFFLEISPYPTILFDENVIPITCNQAMMDVVGGEYGSKREFLETYLERLNAAVPEYQPDGEISYPFQERLRQLFSSGSIRFETALNFPAGQAIADVHMKILEVNGKKLIVGYLLDLSQLRAARRELEKKERLLLALNTLADKYILTPDIRTAVDDMDGSMKILREALDCPYGVIGGYSGAEGTSIGEVFINIPGLSGKPPEAPVEIFAEDLQEGAHIKILPVGVSTVLFVPIYLFGEYWGYLLLGENRGRRIFTRDEKEQLNSAGLIIAAACRRANKLEEFQEAIASANAATVAKTEFLTRMSHEIRTPLNAIIGTASVAAMDDEVKKHSKFSAYLRTIDNSSRHLLHLINEILDMSQIESGKMTVEQSPFILETMLDRVRSIIGSRAADNGLHFLTDFPEFNKYIIGDELRLSQVLINLLGNAAKFTPRDGVISLTVRHLPADGVSGDRLYCKISDTGIGITPEQKARLFVPFEQADGSIARKFGGSGLGLAISEKLVSLMGGKLRLDSVLGEGSVFSFEIPFDFDGDIDRSAQAVDVFEVDWSDRRILVVDDVELNRKILAALLEKSGVQIAHADSGRAAIDYFVGGNVCDLVLMDLQMPEIDGLSATAELRRMEITTPIVAMTANVFREDIDRCIEAGMNGHLGKPIAPEELFKTLGNYLTLKVKNYLLQHPPPNPIVSDI